MCFLLHKFKIMIYPDAFFLFSKFWFSMLVGEGSRGYRAKNCPKWQKKLVSLRISGTVPDYGFWNTYITHIKNNNDNNSKISFFFHFFKILLFCGFSKFINKCQKKILRWKGLTFFNCVWFLQGIKTSYMNLLTLSYPLQYSKRLLT